MHTIHERDETLAFCFPLDGHIRKYESESEYSVEAVVNQSMFKQVQASIGWITTDAQWSTILSELIPDSMVFIKFKGEPIAVACALVRDGGWAELSWVAVDTKYQGKGLGCHVCATSIQKVLSNTQYRVYGSTQDTRLAALNIYLKLGFYPLYRTDKIERWKGVCNKLEIAFTPTLWGWPK